MSELLRIERIDLDLPLMNTYETLAGAVGDARFCRAMATAIRDVAEIDRLYIFDVEGRDTGSTSPYNSQILFAEHETIERPTPHELYVRQYLPVDPIMAAVRATKVSDGMMLLRVEPRDILPYGYRLALEKSRIVERISIVRRVAKRARCLNVARSASKGHFSPTEVARLTSFAHLLLPLAVQHERLISPTRAPNRDLPENENGLCVAALEMRFRALDKGLSPREIEVCARAVFGMTVEGAALDLRIGSASVLTYRKRAYMRLNISSANELAKLIMR